MEIKRYTDEEFFNCKLRGANNVVKAVFGENEKFKNIPPSVLENAAKRGTAVHKCIEDYMNSLKSGKPQEPTIPLEYDIYLHYFNEWRKERATIERVYETECKIISEELACKGIIDCIAKIKTDVDDESKICMIDWKTSSGLDMFRTQCQLQLYYEMMMEEYPDICKEIQELRVLSLTKREYRWFKFPIDRSLGQSILYLYKNYFREEAERRK
jgi:hypothetical protein